MKEIRRTQNPRCFLVYALAPADMPAAEANRAFNQFVSDRTLPLVVTHDHFIGHPGGFAIFVVQSVAERDRLLDGERLPDWQVEFHPLIFSRSPAEFDEQIVFTLRAYRDKDWETLQRDQRPMYGNPRREAETVVEDIAKE